MEFPSLVVDSSQRVGQKRSSFAQGAYGTPATQPGVGSALGAFLVSGPQSGNTTAYRFGGLSLCFLLSVVLLCAVCLFCLDTDQIYPAFSSSLF